MNSPLRILYLEDDAADAALVQDTLEMDGIACHVTLVQTESAFLSALQQDGFDLILADYTLPSFDGLSALRIVRQQRPDLPFIFVSGTLGEEVAIESLKIGATDYVLKSRLSRLVPSVQRALREATERAALRQRDAKIRRLVDASIVGVLVSDLEGRIKEANDAFLEMVRYTREELTSGRIRWTELTPPEWQAVSERAVAQLREKGTCDLFEKEYLRRDGTRVPVLVAAAAIEDTAKESVAFVLDLTDRKRAEALLAGEKRILEMVARGDPLRETLGSLCRLVEEQASGVLASILLLDGNRLRDGAAPSLPKAYTDAIDGGVIGPCAGSCGTAAYRGQQVVVEDIATDPLWADYRQVALRHSLRACWSTPVFSTQAKVIATFAMYYREPTRPTRRDQEIVEQITHLTGLAIERKLTQEKLQRSEAYLAEAQKLSHTGSWAFNAATKKYAYWSEEMFRIWGADPQQDPPDRESVVKQIHPEDRNSVIEAFQNAMRLGKDYVLEFRIILSDGRVRHLRGFGHAVVGAGGEPVEVVGTHIDVTEGKRAEEERARLRHLEADLAHINRVSMMGQLAASLAHELKQPIGAAITNADACLRWLKREPPDVEEAREATMRIVKDGTRAAAVIDRLRSFYKKGAPPESESVDMNEILREMLALLRSEASRYSIPLRTDLAAGLPPVMADRVQLQQVLLNLMLNGIEAMKDYGGELTLTSQLAQDGQLLISVSDTGVGLPAGNVDQIFSAFFSTKPQGSGMGLTISRSIIESHGGRLWATANTGPGATLHFTLPRQMGGHA